tara:strand:- start:613 stop:837 length:225 start_codon:yes stop_codon:yes gene_type:complete
MKKLINRLKPEYLVKLDEVKIKYPTSFNNINKALSREVIYGDLTIMDAYNLSKFLTDSKHGIEYLNTILFEPLN